MAALQRDVAFRLVAVAWFRLANDCCHRNQSLNGTRASRLLQSADPSLIYANTCFKLIVRSFWLVQLAAKLSIHKVSR